MADFENAHWCTWESIEAFLLHEKENGASPDCLRQRRTHLTGLYNWLPQDKLIAYDLLRRWRRSLQEQGYSEVTVLNYIKSVNRYLDFADRSDLRFNRGRKKDLTGKKYGFLTPIECTGEKNRNDYIWKCRCRCGKEVFLPATRLLTGTTLSCGCLQVRHLQEVNQYIDNTSLRSAMNEKVQSDRAASGFTGVTPKRGKWQAYITYKGKRYALGCYSKIEDAVKARADAKALVQEGAKKLALIYQEQHKNDPVPPKRKDRKKQRLPNEFGGFAADAPAV